MAAAEEFLTQIHHHLDQIAPLAGTERTRLDSLLVHKRVDRGSYLVRAGESLDTIGYICEGLFRYFYVDADGKEFTRYFCTAGHFVSPPSRDTISTYSIQALEDSDLLILARTDWLALIESHPYWARVTLAVQEYALQLAERRERSLVLDNALTRYLALLDEFPTIEQHVKQYDIASYLGITPVALSRIRGRTMPSKRTN